MTYTETIKKVVYSLAFVVALVLVVLALTLGLGLKINSNVVARAEGETQLLESITFGVNEDYQDDMTAVLVEGDSIAPYTDAEFTVTSLRSAGEVLENVYALYTSGELNGQKIALDNVLNGSNAKTNNWKLYGVCGDFTLIGEWTAAQIQVTWNIPHSTIYLNGESYSSGEDFNARNPIYYGIGMPEIDMPNARAHGNPSDDEVYRTRDGWIVTYTTASGETDTAKYIPANAISATCTSDTQEISSYTRDKCYEWDVPYTISSSNDSFEYRSGNSAIKSGQYTASADVNAPPYSGFGFYKTTYYPSGSTNRNYNFSGMVLSVRLDGDIRQKIISKAVTQVYVTATVNAQAGVKSGDGNSGRVSMWWDIAEGMGNGLSDPTKPALGNHFEFYVSNSKIVSNFEKFNGKTADVTPTGYTGEHDSTLNTSKTTWKTQSFFDSTKTKTLTASIDQSTGYPTISMFRIGFYTGFFTNGGAETSSHYMYQYALINSIQYTVTGVDSEGNSMFVQDYDLNLNANNPYSTPEESEEVSIKSFSNSFGDITSAPWTYPGYEFAGWTTDLENPVEGNYSLTFPDGATDVKYYAIWKKKQYPIATYDLYSDGTNFSPKWRGASSFENGSVPELSTVNAILNNHDGFVDNGIMNMLGGVLGSPGDWVPLASTSTTNALIVGYRHDLAPVSFVKSDSIESVQYASGSINLDDKFTFSHVGVESRGVTLSSIWQTAEGVNVTFSNPDEHVLYYVTESGDYKLCVTAELDVLGLLGNVSLSSDTLSDAVTFTISPKPITYSWEDVNDYVYNGQYQYPTLSVDGLLESEEVKFIVTFLSGETILLGKSYTVTGATSYEFGAENSVHVTGETIDAGDYTLAFDGKVYYEDGNENLNYTCENALVNKDYSIAKKAINGTGAWQYKVNDGEYQDYAYGTTFTYDGSTITFVTTLDESALVTRVDTGLVDEVPELVYENNVNRNAGEYVINVATTHDNYSLGSNKIFPWSIAHKDIILTWALDGGDVFVKEYDSEIHTLTSNVEGIVDGDDVEHSLMGIASGESVSTNEVVMYFAGEDLVNYNIVGETSQEWSITTKEITLTWLLDGSEVLSVEYDGEDHEITTAINGAIEGDDVTYNFSGVGTAKDAGTYEAIFALVGEDKDNYHLSDDDTKSWTITTKELTLTWALDDGDVFTKVYNGEAHVISADVQGIVGTDEVLYNLNGDVSATDAGNYETTITLSGAQSGNYHLSVETTKSWTINTKELTLTWLLDESEVLSVEYDGEDHEISATINGIVGSDEVTYILTGNTIEKNVPTSGDYQVTIALSGAQSGNYHLSVETTKSWTITTKGLTLTWLLDESEVLSLEYDGEEHEISAIINGIVGSDEVNYTLTGNTIEKNVPTSGDYQVTIALGGAQSGNYHLSVETTKSWTITTKEIGIEWLLNNNNLNTITYAKTEYQVTATATDLVGDDQCLLTLEGTDKATNVDTYDVEVVALSNSNYKLPEDLTFSWSITALPVVLAWNVPTLTYNGLSQGISAYVTNNFEGDDVTPIYEEGTEQAIFVGSYTAKVITLSNSNYSLVGVDNLECDWSIGTKELTLNWALDGNTSLSTEYTSEPHNISSTLNGVVSGDEENVVVALSGDFSATVVGDYYSVATLEGTLSANYHLVDNDTNWTITKKEIGISWFILGEAVTSVVYSKNEYQVTATATGLIGEDTCDLTISQAYVGVYVGSYTAKVTDLSNNNYVLPENVTFTWTITARPVTIEWNIPALTYNGEIQRVTASVSNACDGDVVNVGYQTDSAEAIDAGDYEAEITSITNGNYTLTGVTNLKANWSIQPKEIGINWKVNGLNEYAKIYSASQYTVSATATDLVGYDACTISLDGDITATNVGTYTVTAIALSNLNYVLPEETSLSWSINPKELTDFVWSQNEFTYSASPYTLTVEAQSGVYTNDVLSLTYSSAVVTDYGISSIEGTTATNAGVYSVTLAGLGNDNYFFSGEIATTLTIAKKLLTLTTTDVTSTSYEYDANAQGKKVVLSGMVASDLAQGDISLDSTFNGDTSTTTGETYVELFLGATDVATYDFTVSVVGEKLANYIKPEDVQGNFNITPKAVVISSNSDLAWSKVYDKDISYTLYTYEGVIENTEVSISAEYDDVNKGARKLTFSLTGKDVKNYAFSFAGVGASELEEVANGYAISDALASIFPIKVAVDGETSKTFDGTTTCSDFNVTSGNVLAGDEVVVNAVYDDANVGERTILLSLSNDNYEIDGLTEIAGSVTQKVLTVTFEGAGSTSVYNGLEQGIFATVSGMVEGYEEVILVSGAVEKEFSSLMEDSFLMKNVGSYSVSLALESATSNYTLVGTTTSASWEITAKEITLAWVTDTLGSDANDDYVYDFVNFSTTFANVERSVEAVASGIVDGDQVSLVTTGTKAMGVGNYTSIVSYLSGDDSANYLLPEVTEQDWSITKAEILGVSFDGLTLTYNKTEQVVSLNTLLTQHGIPFAVTYTGGENGENTAINAGTYTITASIEETDNYLGLNLNAVLEIQKRDVEGLVFEGANFVYDSNEKSISIVDLTTTLGDVVGVSYTLNGTTLGGDEISLDTNSIAYAGTYNIVANVLGGNNYNDTTMEATMQIAPKDIMISWTSNVGGIYDGTTQGLTLLVDGIIEGDQVALQVSTNLMGSVENVVANGSYEYLATNAGTYNISIDSLTGTSAFNYVLVGEENNSFNIARRTITIVGWTDGTNQYGLTDTISFEYAKTEYTIAPVYAEGSIVATEEVPVVVESCTATVVGSYMVSATLAQTTNYTMETVSKEWGITPKTITIDWAQVEGFVYDTTIHTVIATANGVIVGDDLTLSYQSNSASDAGNYVAEVVGLSNENYILSDSVENYNWSIAPANITGLVLQNDEFVADGNEYGLTLNKTKTQYGDRVEVSIQMEDEDGNVINANTTNKAGNYLVTATITAGDNYAPLVLTANMKLKLAVLESEKNEEGKVEVSVETESGFESNEVVLESEVTTYEQDSQPDHDVELTETEIIVMKYDIKLTSGGEEVNITEKVTVKLLLNETLLSSEFRIVLVNEEETTELEYEIEDGYAVLETDAFGSLMFVMELEEEDGNVGGDVEDGSEDTDEGGEQLEGTIQDESKDENDFIIWIVIGVVSVIILIVLIVVISFVSKKRTIKFELSDVKVEEGKVRSIKARYGQKVNLPTPTYKGENFSGWYHDEDCTRKATVQDVDTEDKVLYAKRTKAKSKVHISKAFTDQIKFQGWYYDPGYTKKADLTKMGGKDITLYGKFGKNKKKSSPPARFSVKLN